MIEDDHEAVPEVVDSRVRPGGVTMLCTLHGAGPRARNGLFAKHTYPGMSTSV